MDGYKIINDPVFGFIKIRMGLIYDIVQHPLFQRLNRINQLGLASVVYPGARHTRFQHSLGSLFLMSEAVKSLKEKGVYIFDSEEEAVKIAILLHDIGHGPFSHVLEHTLMHGISHEDISLLMMEQINREKHGELNLAISIFKDEYPNKIFHQLISSQLDMDRLDYLRRDSFFTGVTEGNIGSARIIKMLNVKDDRLVIESKGIYSIENFLTTRRLMYWQVYLHKTTVACEKVLVNTLKRAKGLAKKGHKIFAPPSLQYFLYNDVDRDWFMSHDESLMTYSQLDDNDIWCAVKEWSRSDDPILSLLSMNLVNRKPFKVEISEEPFSEDYLHDLRHRISLSSGIAEEECKYLMSVNAIEKDMYDVNDDHISILYNDGTTKDITEASEILNVALLSKKVKKYYLCYQRLS